MSKNSLMTSYQLNSISFDSKLRHGTCPLTGKKVSSLTIGGRDGKVIIDGQSYDASDFWTGVSSIASEYGLALVRSNSDNSSDDTNSSDDSSV